MPVTQNRVKPRRPQPQPTQPRARDFGGIVQNPQGPMSAPQPILSQLLQGMPMQGAPSMQGTPMMGQPFTGLNPQLLTLLSQLTGTQNSPLQGGLTQWPNLINPYARR